MGLPDRRHCLIRAIPLTRAASRSQLLVMNERTKIGRGTLFNPDRHPIKKVDYEITPEDSVGRLYGVPKGFLVRRKGWSLEDEKGQRWSVETEFEMVDEDLAKSWIDVVVSKTK